MKNYIVPFALLAAVACRADPGEADYSSHEGLREQSAPPEFLPGPVPFVESVPRLSIGIFYENGFTERVPVNNGVDTFYFIFDTAGNGTGISTYDQESTSDRVEGQSADRFVHAGTGFWGGGVFWYVARDISTYTTLNVSLKSSDEAFGDVTIAMESGPDRPPGGEGDQAIQARVRASAYGYSNDGEWHTLTIPFSDLAGQGFDPRSVRAPIVLLGGAGTSGERLLVDDVYIQ
ncbi:MAG: hypothetical protein AAFN74_00945 [Myxococcota bacterium]